MTKIPPQSIPKSPTDPGEALSCCLTAIEFVLCGRHDVSIGGRDAEQAHALLRMSLARIRIAMTGDELLQELEE